MLIEIGSTLGITIVLSVFIWAIGKFIDAVIKG